MFGLVFDVLVWWRKNEGISIWCFYFYKNLFNIVVMVKIGLIIIIDDDMDDIEVIKDILIELGVENVIYYYGSCDEVL